MLETFKSSFDVDSENKDVLTLLQGVEFEAGVSEAVQGAIHGSAGLQPSCS